MGQTLNCEVTAERADDRRRAPATIADRPRADRRAGDQRRPAPAPDAELHPRHLARRRRRPLHGHLPLAAQQHRDHRRHHRHLHAHRGRRRHRASTARRAPRTSPRASSAGVGVTAPRIVLGQVLSGQPRLRKTMTCSRGTWDDIAADRYAVTLPVAARQRRDRRPDRRRPTTSSPADTGHSISVHSARREPHQRVARQRRRDRARAAEPGRARACPATHALRQTLSLHAAATGTTRPSDRYAVAYRWLRDGTAIAGATAATYTITAAPTSQHEHRLPRPRRGPHRTRTSASHHHPPAGQPASRPRSPATRACSARCPAPAATGTTRPPTATRSRTRGSATASQIPGATAPTYTLSHDDVNKSIYCRVRAEDLVDANSGSVFVDAPARDRAAALSGQPHLRGELSCTRGTWDDTPEKRYAVSYQWYRNGIPINGATDPTLRARRRRPQPLHHLLGDRRGAARQLAPQRVYVYGPYDTETPAHRGRRAPAPRADLHARRVERLGRQALRAQLPVAAQQRQPIAGADGARPRRGRRGRRHEPDTARSPPRARTPRRRGGSYPTWEPLRLDAAPRPRRHRAERVQRVHAAPAQRQPGAGDDHDARADACPAGSPTAPAPRPEP